MDRQQLENYTKNHLHHGVNSQEVLEKFMTYQSLCSEPLLVFRYMEQKAVCTFLASFWIAKAELYAQLGDYSNSFECLDLAGSRIDEDQKQIMTLVEQTQSKIRQKMVEEMKKYPLKTKRSVSQFSLNQDDSISSTKQRQVEMVKLYEEKYGGLRREKEMKFQQSWKNKPKSWLFDYYQKEDEKEKMIEEQIHEHSVKISKDVKYHSMHTPIKARDPQRLTKTMDSVQILKKKRSTRQKSKKNFNPFHEDHQSEPDIGMDEDSNSRMMVSLPVGRKFASIKRRVTFKSDCSIKIEKIRKEQIPPSFDKAVEQDLVRDQQKMQQESEVPEAYSEKLSKK